MCLRYDLVVILLNILVEVGVIRNFSFIIEFFLVRLGVLCNRLFKIVYFYLGFFFLFVLRLNGSV